MDCVDVDTTVSFSFPYERMFLTVHCMTFLTDTSPPVLHEACSKIFSHEAHFGQEAKAEPSFASLGSSPHRQYSQIQHEASLLAPHQVGIVRGRQVAISLDDL